MAPPRRPAPPDLLEVAEQCDFQYAVIARHYANAGMPVDKRTVGRWLTEVEDGGKAENVPNRTIREIIKDAGDDPDKVEVTKVRGMRYDTPAGPHLYVSAEWKPSLAALAVRPEGWKRPKIAKRKGSEPELIVVCGDQHAPEHDRELHAQFLSWLAENQPSQIVMLGDLLENSDVSRWEDRDGEATAEQSVDAAYYMIRDYIDAAPNAKLVWVAGNHDVRIGKYQRQGAPKLANIHRAGETEPVISLAYLLRLDELGVELIGDYPLGKYKLADNLVVIHGDKAKQGAGATAREHLQKRGYSIISGHVHRAAIIFKTTFDEDDTPSILCGVETGTLKKIKPEVFDATPDHQNFFVTVTKWGPRDWHIEPATFAGGHLRWRDQRFG